VAQPQAHIVLDSSPSLLMNICCVGPALAAVPSRNARDGRNGMPTSGSPTTLARMVISRTTNASQLCAVSE